MLGGKHHLISGKFQSSRLSGCVVKKLASNSCLAPKELGDPGHLVTTELGGTNKMLDTKRRISLSLYHSLERD